MREYVLISVVAAIVTFVMTPLARWSAVRFGAVTQVRARDVHALPIPRLGGVAIFAGYAAATLLAWRLPFLSQVFETVELIGVLAAGAVVCLVGAVDDVKELDALTKLGGQLVAAAIIAFAVLGKLADGLLFALTRPFLAWQDTAGDRL